ncbi:MAG: HAMP domain-containing sensor histidine kinase [Cyanobacteriota bacterium]
MFNRSRRNLARWFTLSMGSILIVFAGVIYYQKVTDELEILDRLLYTKTRVMAASVKYEFAQEQWQVNLENVPLLGNNASVLASEVVYARWYNPDGKLLQFFGLPPTEALIVEDEFLTIKTTHDSIEAMPTGVWLRQVTLPVEQAGTVIGYLQVATLMTPVQEAVREFLLLLTLSVPVALGVIGFTGWFLGGLAMQPIHQAYEQLQRFTANASHELRTPLAAILSNAQAGLLFPDEDGSEQRYRLEQIVEVTKSMSSLVSNLLLLARHAGRLDLDALVEIDLTNLLRELVNSYESQATAKDLSLNSHFPEQPIAVKADPNLLRQAVGNLLGNACNYTSAGGIVQLRLFTQSRCAVIQVEDNGIGIPAADLPHIFDRFYRVNAGQSRQRGGFGLGLAIAKQLVEAHGGQISVTSVVGQGSTFQIELPLN